MERQLFDILELRNPAATCRRRANDRKARILTQRFEDRMTLRAIATEQNVTPECIRQIERRAIDMLARPLRIDHLRRILPPEHRLLQAVEAARREHEYSAQLWERNHLGESEHDDAVQISSAPFNAVDVCSRIVDNEDDHARA